MKRKYADYPNWDRLNEKKFVYKYFNNEEFKGHICLLTATKVKEKLTIIENDKEIVLLDDNYKWLEIYPENNKNIAISVAITNQNKIVEWYFDIAKYTGLTNTGIPYIDDLYLDIILYPSGKLKLIDENELQEALFNKEITKEDFDLAYNIADKLIKNIHNQIDKLTYFTNKYLNYFFKEEIDNG